MLGRNLRIALCVISSIFVAGVTAFGARKGYALWSYAHPKRVAVWPLADRRDLAGFRSVEFRAVDGVNLEGWWQPAKNGIGILLVHGLGQNRQQLVPQAAILRDRGFGVLLFDLRAHGTSGGTSCTGGDRERIDVKAAVEFLSQQGVHRIGGVGYSMGGRAVALAALEDKRIAAIVIEATTPSIEANLLRDYATGPFPGWLVLLGARAFGIRGDVLRDEDFCALAPRPIFLIYGERDTTSPVEVGERLLHAACGPAKLWVLQGARHGDWAGYGVAERLESFFSGTLSGSNHPSKSNGGESQADP